MKAGTWTSIAVGLLLATTLVIGGCAGIGQNQLIDGKPEGPWTTYYPYGQKQESGSYRDGLRVGTWRRWHINGELQWVMNFETGQRHGSYIAYYNDGSPRERGQFERGRKTGEWTRYFPGDKGSQRIVYQNGELVSREDIGVAPAARADPEP